MEKNLPSSGHSRRLWRVVCAMLMICLLLPGNAIAAPSVMNDVAHIYLPLLQVGMGNQPSNPSWKILTLIYHSIDFTYQDSSGETRHLISTMSAQEQQRAEQKAILFATYDVPRLTSGQMIPGITIRHITKPLTRLSPHPCADYAPAPEDIGADRDLAFDAVIVIWDGEGEDTNTGEAVSVEGCAYSWDMGLSPAYATLGSSWLRANDRNVFKHEWGHSILFYYNAAGTAPQPAVDNHINNTDRRYVNCKTGQPYILQDETDYEPIPNSIYNNESGFTHDYYSGFTAEADIPGKCLGINAQAWASGGPVTGPGNTPRATRPLKQYDAGNPAPYPIP